MKKLSVKKMVLIAMLCAVAYIMVFTVRIPVVMFLKYEPKDIIITIGGFLLGPPAAFFTSFIVAFLEMITISDTGPIGFVMNMLSSCAFACTASFIYKKKHTLGGAVVGLAVGSVLTVAVMMLWNWLISPLYMDATREEVAALLVPAFLPFNALKVGLNMALTLVLYKPLVTALRRTGLVEKKPKSGSKFGPYLLGAALLVTCVLFLLVLRGII